MSAEESDIFVVSFHLLKAFPMINLLVVLVRCVLSRSHTEHVKMFRSGRDMTSRCAALKKKLKLNTQQIIIHLICKKHTICCSLKFVLLIKIGGYAVTYRSAICHTVSLDAK